MIATFFLCGDDALGAISTINKNKIPEKNLRRLTMSIHPNIASQIAQLLYFILVQWSHYHTTPPPPPTVVVLLAMIFVRILAGFWL